MKKIMIAVAAALIGVALNAATVNWSVNAVQSSPAADVAAGWVVQIFTQSVTYDYAAAKDGKIDAWSSGSTVAAGPTFRASGSVTDGQDNGTTVGYYMVIYDATTVAAAKNYIISDIVSVTTDVTGSPKNAAFGAMSGTTAANKFLGSSWQAVPEPTSGLLLLLGVAGLALRRKQK